MNTRSFLYRAARELGDYNAVKQSVKTGSLAPVAKRYVRKAAYRKTNSTLARALKWLMK